VLTGVIGFFVVVACAATLHRDGLRINDAADAAVALEPLAGEAAATLFGVGLIGASFLAASILPLSTAYSVCEYAGVEAALDDPYSEARTFYTTYGIVTLLGTAIVLAPDVPLVTILVGTLVPFATPLIGMLMLGNLMKESGVVERLTKASSQEIANVVTLFLGLAIGSTMVGVEFLKLSTLAILVLGIVAFGVDTAAGILFAKLMNVVSGGKINPLVGAAGISAFPMAARVVQRVAHEADFENFLLMHAMGANAAGQVASVVAGGVLLALMGAGGH
jgi:hypothetical protein